MNINYIIQKVGETGRIAFNEKMFRSIPEFQSSRRVASMESLLLEMGGHEPIKDYYFDIKKVEEWAKHRNIDFLHDELNRIVYLENRKPWKIMKLEK